MASFSVHITHGPMTRIEGVLSPVIETQLKRKGAFYREDSWWIDQQKWARIYPMLKAMGVRIQSQEGDSTLHARIDVDDYGRLVLSDTMPRRLEKVWLGHMQGSQFVGFTPYALSEVIGALEGQNVTVDVSNAAEALRERVDDMLADAAVAKMGAMRPDVELHDPEHNALWDHQVETMGMVEATGGRVYDMSEPGVGKTATAIGAKRMLGAKRIVAVVPAVAKGNWRDEILRFDGAESFIMEGRKPQPMPKVQWYIINPDILHHRLSELQALRPDMVIADESHAYKSATSQRTKALSRLVHDSKWFMALTGTPIPNNTIDLWPVLHALQPNWWGTYYEFGHAFCNPTRNHWASKKAGRTIYQFKGVTEENLPTLRARLAAISIRHKLTEVRDMPPQTRTVYRVGLPSAAQKQYSDAIQDYRAFMADLLDGVPESGRERVLDANAGERAKFALRLRKISSLGRVKGTVELAMSYIEQGQRPVVFAYYRDTIEALVKAFGGQKVGVIHGDVTPAKRDAIVDDFNAGGLDVLMAQVQAGGVAINLDKGSNLTITHEVTYEPIHMTQAEGRVFRAGQTKPVQHVYMVAEDTVDEYVVKALMEKIRAADAVLEGVSVENEILTDFEADL